MRRFDELDSLRGLAALTVLIGHCLILLPYFGSEYNASYWLLNAIIFTPLSIIWAGHEAVILFFILSGFVLSLPYYSGKEQPYFTFIIRRIFRIYLPYLLVIALAIVVRSLITNQNNLDLNNWIYTLWDEKVSWNSIFNHIIFLGNYNSRVFDPVVWSLIEEMRISIIFPVIMFVVLRFNWKINIAVCMFCSFVSNFLYYVKWHFSFSFLPSILGVLSTIEWIPMFIIGALIAKNLKFLIARFKSLSSWGKVVILNMGILSYTYSHWVNLKGSIVHQQMIQDGAITLGAIIFVISSVSSKTVARFLSYKPIKHCGKISYSLYLVHMIILLSLVHLCYGIIPLWLIWMITFISTLIVSTISYHFVEVPLIALGRKLTSRIPKLEVMMSQSRYNSKKPSEV